MSSLSGITDTEYMSKMNNNDYLPYQLEFNSCEKLISLILTFVFVQLETFVFNNIFVSVQYF